MEYLRGTIVYKLLAARKKLVAAVNQDFNDVEITLENYITLHFIYENPGITQNDLAELNSKDKNVIVKSLDKFERLGWARRERGKEDRRSFNLYITESGKKIIGTYWKRLVKRQTDALSMLSADEKESLDALLNKILD